MQSKKKSAPRDGCPGGAVEVGTREPASTKTSERALPLISEAELARYGVTVDAFGLNISRELTFDDCKAVGCALGRKQRGYQWGIGDLWHYSCSRYGEGKAMAIEFGIPPDTAKNYGYVSGNVEKSRRRDLW